MNILNNLQKEFLRALGKSPLGQEYVWTGGTALAYRLTHRYSTDLDFFSIDLTSPELFLAEVQKVQHTLKLQQENYEERMNRRMFIMKKGKDIVRVEFVYFPFPPLIAPKRVSELGIRIDTVQDIAVNKVLSVFQRKEPKDVYDLYVLCAKEKYQLSHLIKLVEKKFGVKIDEASLIAKLVAVGGDLDNLRPLLVKGEPYLKKKVVEFFEEKGRKYLRTFLI